jgi:ligand-binding SRPBCC domain-containing protein
MDRVIRGPVESWEHQHIFKEVEGGIELIDHVELVHRSSGFWGIFTRLAFGSFPLRLLFMYRHLRTRRATTRDSQ